MATIRVPVEVATIRIKPFLGDLDSTVVDLHVDKLMKVCLFNRI